MVVCAFVEGGAVVVCALEYGRPVVVVDGGVVVVRALEDGGAVEVRAQITTAIQSTSA